MVQIAISLFGTGFVGLAVSAGSVFAVRVVALQLAGDTLPLYKVLIILFLTSECFRPLADLTTSWHQGYMCISAAPGIEQCEDTEPEITEPTEPLQDIPVIAPPTIAFEQATFAYNTRERPALRDLSFAIEPGEAVGMVGRSGARKSTVVALLLRVFTLLAEGQVYDQEAETVHFHEVGAL